MVQKDAFSCGPDPSILDNRSVRGGSRDPLKSIKNLTGRRCRTERLEDYLIECADSEINPSSIGTGIGTELTG